MADKDKKDPSVTLSFGQLVGLALFILSIIGGSVKLLYDAIDKRLERFEDKVDKHDERLDGIEKTQSAQGVKLEHLMQLRAKEARDDSRIADASAGNEPEEEDEIAPLGSRRARRSRSHSLGEASGYGMGMGSGSGKKSSKKRSRKPSHHPASNPDAPMLEAEPAPMAMMLRTRVTESPEDSAEPRKLRRQRKCEKRWKKGCPLPSNPLSGNLREASDQLVDMQLRESSNRLAKLQRKERT